jgi:cytochrome c2
MMTKTLIVAVALTATSTDAGMAQDVAKGEISFKKCVICHSIGPGAQNKVGPAQNGLDGRKAGSVPNYQYSDANKNSGIVWNEARNSLAGLLVRMGGERDGSTFVNMDRVQVLQDWEDTT